VLPAIVSLIEQQLKDFADSRKLIENYDPTSKYLSTFDRGKKYNIYTETNGINDTANKLSFVSIAD
jgi:nitrate reductase assembly molybdenum cofactor insertion protein NarJ